MQYEGVAADAKLIGLALNYVGGTDVMLEFWINNGKLFHRGEYY